MMWIKPPTRTEQGSTLSAKKEKEKSSSYGNWLQMPITALVMARDSSSGTVDVKAQDGRIFSHVPVRPPYWTGLQGQANPSAPTGGRDLPPINSEVVIIFLNGSIDRPLVLCSAPNNLETWQSQNVCVQGKENQKITYLEQNWTFEFDADTGDMTLSSDPNDSNRMVVSLSRSKSLIKVSYGSQFFSMDGTKFDFSSSAGSLGKMFDNLISTLSAATTLNSVNSPNAFDPSTQIKLSQWQVLFDALVSSS